MFDKQKKSILIPAPHIPLPFKIKFSCSKKLYVLKIIAFYRHPSYQFLQVLIFLTFPSHSQTTFYTFNDSFRSNAFFDSSTVYKGDIHKYDARNIDVLISPLLSLFVKKYARQSYWGPLYHLEGDSNWWQPIERLWFEDNKYNNNNLINHVLCYTRRRINQHNQSITLVS